VRPLRGAWPNFGNYLQGRDVAPDLGSNIGSKEWFRGVLTCIALCAGAVLLLPDFKPIASVGATSVGGTAWEETRAQTIAPLAWGGDVGRRMGATNLVLPLGNAPERPSITLTATLGQGDGFARVLERAGASSAEARAVAQMVSTATPLDQIAAGTPIDLTFGRRTGTGETRPIELMKLRARIDLSLMAHRVGPNLELTRIPIAVNRTPLRIQGQVGTSLYRSARAAGVPAKAVESYIKAIASKLSFERDIDASSRFDLVVEQAKAETGEVEHGRLLYAGMTTGPKRTQMIQWTIGSQTEWYEASGVGEKRGGMTSPIAGGRITSGFGWRFHPILGYNRMHKGIDFGAAVGTPVHAVTDGLVSFAGHFSGYGNHVRLNHNANLGSSYSHLSRIIVTPGSRVSQGQVVGYVGSTGLSTGPHLHFEVYVKGAAVDPRRVSFESNSLLSGAELQAFRARLSAYLAVPVSGSKE
jgi:murein DD-endopeptidase MepM/ murein hydrolase activator NlpD